MQRFATILTLGLGVALLNSSCARPPRPASLVQADQVREARTIQDAAPFAPQALAHANSLWEQAQQAYDAGEIAKSGILAERAIVAYERAAILARLARAELLSAEAEKKLEESARDQRTLDAEKARLEADIATIEQLILVVKDATPRTPISRSDHSREMARLAAARSTIVDARLLCTSAKLLTRPLEGLDEAQAEVLRLEEVLAQWPKPAPLDEALRARTSCLALLTLARRMGKATTPADKVLSELSAEPAVSPMRDDRGVVVVIHGDIQRDATAKAQLEAITRTATKYPEFPLLVVAHTRAKAPITAQHAARDRSLAIVSALESAGIEKSRIDRFEAGPHRPIVHDPLPPPRNSKNDRIEVVLVDPSS